MLSNADYVPIMFRGKYTIVATVSHLFTEKPTDSPRTMFISKDQWVEEGGRVRLYCEALIGKVPTRTIYHTFSNITNS